MNISLNFSKLIQPSLQFSFRALSWPQKIPLCLLAIHLCSHPILGNHRSVSTMLSFPKLSCEWNHIICSLWCLSPSISYNAFIVNNVLLYRHTISCLSIYQLMDTVSSLRALVNNTAMNIRMQAFVWTYFFISFG